MCIVKEFTVQEQLASLQQVMPPPPPLQFRVVVSTPKMTSKLEVEVGPPPCIKVMFVLQ